MSQCYNVPNMKQILLSIFLLIASVAQSGAIALAEPAVIRPDLAPMVQNYHSYTYVVEEDGSARVWLLMDNVQTREQAQTVRYTLPDNYTGETLVWYRENGCMEYRQDNCVYYGNTNWQALEVQADGRKLEISVPQAKYPGRFGENNVSLGLMFTIDDATSKNWWGRTVNIRTGSTDQYVANVNVGVYLPQGLYTRDRNQGPDNWAASLSESISIQNSRPNDVDFQSAQAMMLDRAGSGQVYRYAYNLLPGASYSFSFISSGSLWALYYAEILVSLLWLVAIAAVVATLLRLIVGKKPLRWYMAIIGLLVLLSVLLGGLWFTFYTAFGNQYGGGYPMPFMGVTTDMNVNYSDGGVMNSAPAEIMPMEAAVDDGEMIILEY